MKIHGLGGIVFKYIVTAPLRSQTQSVWFSRSLINRRAKFLVHCWPRPRLSITLNTAPPTGEEGNTPFQKGSASLGKMWRRRTLANSSAWMSQARPYRSCRNISRRRCFLEFQLVRLFFLQVLHVFGNWKHPMRNLQLGHSAPHAPLPDPSTQLLGAPCVCVCACDLQSHFSH